MNPLILIQLALQSIVTNKMRSLLTTLGIIIGVGAVIIMMAIGEGARTQIRTSINSLGTNLIVIYPGSSNSSGVSRGAGSNNRLTVKDAEYLSRQNNTLAGVSPMIMAPSQIVGGQGNWRALVYGVSTDYLIIRDWQTTSGSAFTQNDLLSRKKVVLIGQTVAKNLFPEQDPVGQRLRIRNVPFEIIGLLTEKGQNASGRDQDDVIIAPYTTVQTRLSGRQFITQIIASAASQQEMDAAQEEIGILMREAHNLSDWEEDDVTIRNQTDLAEAASVQTEVMTVLLAAIASISLLVGGIGIMNIMLVSVTERTKEIGIRMAVGAKSYDILSQFLVESIVVSLIGGILGVALGIGGGQLVGEAMGWPVAFVPDIVMLALFFSMAVGVFFGFYPAKKAAALNPIDALRHE